MSVVIDFPSASGSSSVAAITSGTITGLTNLGVSMANNTAITGFALGTISDTTARPLIVSQTFNNASLSGCALRVDITDTSSADLSPFFQINRGGSRFLAVSKKTAWGISNMPTIEGDAASGGQIAFNSSAGSVILARKDVGWNFVSLYTGSYVASGARLGFSANTFAQNVLTTGDAYFTRAAAASIKMGETHASTPTDQTFSAHDVTSGTGAALTLRGGQGTTGGATKIYGGAGATEGAIFLGESAASPISIWGTSPLAQPAALADLTATASITGSDTVSESVTTTSIQNLENKVNDILAKLRVIGLIAA